MTDKETVSPSTKKEAKSNNNRFGVEGRFGTEEDIREEFVYSPRSETKMPAELKEQFAADGYRLRWVRWRDGDGRIDTSNLRKTIHADGFEFVRPQELGQDEVAALGELQAIDKHGECVCLGDLVLMKVKDYKADARDKYFRGKAREKEDATNELLRRNAIENGSKTVTKVGRKAHYAAD
jgi:hypothetical protein